MFPMILGVAVVVAVVAILVKSPTEPWDLNGELWYEQFAPKPGRDAFREELAVMRLEAELAPKAAQRPVARPLPAGRTASPRQA